MEPVRVQLRRSRGWRMPSNAIKIDRSTKWGNPFKVGENTLHPVSGVSVSVTTKEVAIALFRLYLENGGAEIALAAGRELRGRNLACWCKDGQACHGDVLLQIANAPVHINKAA
jgi:hypothetical protein